MLRSTLALALAFMLGCHEPAEVTPRSGQPTLMAFVPVKEYIGMLVDCAPINSDLSLTVTYTEILPPNPDEQFFRMNLAALTSAAQSDCFVKALIEAGGEIIDDTGDIETGTTT